LSTRVGHDESLVVMTILPVQHRQSVHVVLNEISFTRHICTRTRHGKGYTYACMAGTDDTGGGQKCTSMCSIFLQHIPLVISISPLVMRTRARLHHHPMLAAQPPKFVRCCSGRCPGAAAQQSGMCGQLTAAADPPIVNHLIFLRPCLYRCHRV
jgi:hypothetical protein